VTRHELRRGSDAKERIVETIVKTRVSTTALESRTAIRRYLAKYFQNVPVEDLVGRSEPVMAKIALSHLEFAARRRKGKALIRIFNPTEKEHGYDSNYTFVEMVNDDMPFLVDSVTAAITRQDFSVHITVHPIIHVRRDGKGKLESVTTRDDPEAQAESFIRIAFDKETDRERLASLKRQLADVLGDVRITVRDWPKMRERMREARELLDNGPPGADPELREESRALLEWMADDRFTFIGYREYRLSRRGDRIFLKALEETGLGILAKRDAGKTIELTNEMRRLARSKDWLILNKANSRSTVHRNAYLDYVGVKIYNKSGKAVGERRFLGLYTSIAYSENPRNIPLLRHKVEKVVDRTHVDPAGHRGKALMHILDTFPRDELFQATVSDLARTTLGVLNLQDRQRVRFFLRRDAFRRFFSCLVYVPRDKYTTAVRRKIESILLDAFDGQSLDSSVEISDSPLARVHIIVHTRAGERPRISIQSIEARIADVVVTWNDKLRECLYASFGQDDGHKLFREYGNVFPAGYQEDTSPRDACSDISTIDEMLTAGRRRTVELYKPEGSEPGHMHFMIYSDGEPLALSEALKVLEDMGVDGYSERPYELLLKSGDSFWIQDFHLRHESGAEVDVEDASKRFEECFTRVLGREAERDGLNRLILSAGLDWREVALLRCYTKYLLQLTMPFSQDYMEDVLVMHAGFVRLLIEQFQLRFDPSIAKAKRDRDGETGMQALRRKVAKARSVDEDRILNAFVDAIAATLRTNYFQRDAQGDVKPCISIKLESRKLPEAPLPRPKYEIFVYSTEVEGVHLRAGDIARGGLRWSDRREDFRTEVLGLMKAQVVKNTVIVPTGAKGGFYCKRLPDNDRDAIQKKGIDCYRTFISGLLDITDNVVDGNVVTPDGVVRRDSEDPYLVVAADKGTATFSDIANEISASYGFWLDDAFASGGSAGYDHKKMGITARGAWEAVKRHFREQGLDTQKQAFSVAGIGDMSGDVFGNGMLLSRKIRLVAAFNHMHIFIDPDPDPSPTYKERRRLFRKARSTWADYNTELISKGGGIFSRQSKSIRLSAEMRELLDTDAKKLKPDEVVQAILRMRVDLLWNGGIGTYVKASAESHADAGDRSNDRVRVNADELRCKVVGEGGNLGLTQRARVEFSLAGGRINTDFIDNSAGVDSSDREVNIKILLSDVAVQKGMTRDKRDELLASMTDDVADLVLRNNYLQTQAISMSEVRSLERIDETARVITSLERSGLLDRDLEFLPDDVEIEDRKARKQGITRPELAVILSYAKIDVYNGLVAAQESLVDFLEAHRMRYFPEVLRRRYADLVPKHRLSPQILATLIANDIVNRMGPAFVRRVQLDTGANVVTIARAYTVARQICKAGDLNRTIQALDNEIPADAQMAMLFEVARTQRHAVYWLIERFGENIEIAAAAERLAEGMATVYTRMNAVMSTAARQRHNNAVARFLGMGVPDKLAERMAALLLTHAALDISDLATEYGQDYIETAKVYSAFNENLGLFWLHVGTEDLEVHGRWESQARTNLRDEFYRVRRQLAEQLLSKRSKKPLPDLVETWLAARTQRVERFKHIIEDMKLRNERDFASLSVAARELRELVET